MDDSITARITTKSENSLMNALYCGQTFTNLPELKTALSNYEKTNYVNLSVRAANKIRRRSKYAIPPDTEWTKRLIYCHLKYTCNKGGTKRVSTSKGLRPNCKSLLQDCPMFVKIGLTKDKQELIVKKVNMTHNHPVDRETYENLPRQRGLTELEKLAVVELVEEFKLDKRLVLEKMKRETGKHITMKAIHNILYVHKKRTNEDVNGMAGNIDKEQTKNRCGEEDIMSGSDISIENSDSEHAIDITEVSPDKKNNHYSHSHVASHLTDNSPVIISCNDKQDPDTFPLSQTINSQVKIGNSYKFPQIGNSNSIDNNNSHDFSQTGRCNSHENDHSHKFPQIEASVTNENGNSHKFPHIETNVNNDNNDSHEFPRSSGNKSHENSHNLSNTVTSIANENDNSHKFHPPCASNPQENNSHKFPQTTINNSHESNGNLNKYQEKTPHHDLNSHKFSQQHAYHQQFLQFNQGIASNSMGFPQMGGAQNTLNGHSVDSIQSQRINRFCGNIFQSLMSLNGEQQNCAMRHVEHILLKVSQNLLTMDGML